MAAKFTFYNSTEVHSSAKLARPARRISRSVRIIFFLLCSRPCFSLVKLFIPIDILFSSIHSFNSRGARGNNFISKRGPCIFTTVELVFLKDAFWVYLFPFVNSKRSNVSANDENSFP